MSDTRRAAVLDALKGADGAGGHWVNGTELANADVGGSEGLKRLRELRAIGWPIEMRRHPDEKRTVRQYRLTPQTEAPWPDGSAVVKPAQASLSRTSRGSPSR